MRARGELTTSCVPVRVRRVRGCAGCRSIVEESQKRSRIGADRRPERIAGTDTWAMETLPGSKLGAPGLAAPLGTVAAVSLALLGVLRQRRIENRRDRREHAESISAWIAEERPPDDIEATGGTSVQLENASQHLAYEVVVFQVYIQGAGPRTGEDWRIVLNRREKPTTPRFRENPFAVLGVLQPGRSVADLDWLSSIMQGRLAVEVAFTDRAGQHWIRRSTGHLAEISQSPIDYYDIGRPVDYTRARSV